MAQESGHDQKNSQELTGTLLRSRAKDRNPQITTVPARPTGACQTNCGTGAGMSDNGDGYSTPPDETVVYDGLPSDGSQLATGPTDARLWWVQ